MTKTIYIRPFSGMTIGSILLGVVFVFAGISSLLNSEPELSNVNYKIAYIIVGFISLTIGFKSKMFAKKKYIKISENYIDIKRWALTKVISIKIDEITEIKVIASRVSIKFANSAELVNLDWVSSRTKNDVTKALEEFTREKEIPFEIIQIFDKFKEKKKDIKKK